MSLFQGSIYQQWCANFLKVLAFFFFWNRGKLGESLHEGDFTTKYFNLSNDKRFLEECVKIRTEGNESYPMRCLIFKPPESEHTQYVTITMKKDVPFLTFVDFHEHQRSSCPTAISLGLERQVYLIPRKEFYIRYVLNNSYTANNVLTFLTLNFLFLETPNLKWSQKFLSIHMIKPATKIKLQC